MAGSTLLFSEVLDRVHKAKTKDQKVKILRDNNTPALRSVLKASFDPKIRWVVPEGEVPFTKNDAPIGTEHTTLASESRKLFHFIKGGDGQRINLPGWRWARIKQLALVGSSSSSHSEDCKALEGSSGVVHSKISVCGSSRTRGSHH